MGIASYVGSYVACLVGRLRGAPAPPPATLLDAPTVAAVVTLVRLLSRPDVGADELADRLTTLYRRFPPTEVTMRRLSLLHQRHGDEGGMRSFCVALVYMAATEAILHGAARATTTARPRPRSR